MKVRYSYLKDQFNKISESVNASIDLLVGKEWKLVNEAPPWKDKIHHKFIVFKNSIFLIGGRNDSAWKTNNGIDWEEIELKPKFDY